MATKKKPTVQPLYVRMTVWLTATQKKRLKQESKKSGESVSELIRQAVTVTLKN